MDGRYRPVLLLACTVPQLISNLKLVDHSVLKAKIIAYCRNSFLTELRSHHPFDQRGLPCRARTNETYLYVFINLFGIFLDDLHEWKIECIVFIRDQLSPANPAFVSFFDAILTNRMTTRNDLWLSEFGVIPEETCRTLHKAKL